MEDKKDIFDLTPPSILGEDQNFGEMLDEATFLGAGLKLKEARQAARAAMESKEKKIVPKTPDAKAYQKELDYLKSQVDKNNANRDQ